MAGFGKFQVDKINRRWRGKRQILAKSAKHAKVRVRNIEVFLCLAPFACFARGILNPEHPILNRRRPSLLPALVQRPMQRMHHLARLELPALEATVQRPTQQPAGVGTTRRVGQLLASQGQ